MGTCSSTKRKEVVIQKNVQVPQKQTDMQGSGSRKEEKIAITSYTKTPISEQVPVMPLQGGRPPQVSQKQIQGIVENTNNTNSLNQAIGISKSQLSRFYSMMIRTKMTQDAIQGFSIQQHNLTGKIRKIRMLSKSEPNSQKLIEKLTQINICHPNISKVLEIYQDETKYYVVQEYMAGGTLVEMVNSKKVDELKIATIISQIASAIEYLHSLGYLHGSLNLLSFQLLNETENNEVKLTDFENLIIKPEITTMHYQFFPPEYNTQDDIKSATDVWAIGIIMYYLLTGILPYAKKNTIEQMKQQLKRRGPSFDGMEFEQVSKPAISLLSRLLSNQNRITISQLCNDYWLKQTKNPKVDDIKQNMKRLKCNKKVGMLQASIILYMINQFNSAEQQNILNLFDKMDENSDHKLSKEEMLKVYSTIVSKEEAIAFVDNIFAVADTDQSGEIDFYEFIVSVTDKTALLTRSNIEITFKMLSDKNGFISLHHLSTKFKLTKETLVSELSEILQDQKQKRQISYDQFRQIMLDAV